MKILVFGGTTEGRDLCLRLLELPVDVTVSVATPLGAEEISATPGLHVLIGRKTAEEIGALAKSFDLVVDATHPYAVEVTENIRAGCEAAGIPVLRLLRAGEDAGDGAVHVASCAEAAAYLAPLEGNVLSTVGTKALPDFAPLERTRLFARVLPTVASIEQCEAVGLPHRNILALYGPFSEELNVAMMRQCGIRYMVTKDTGPEGGLPEKLAAAEKAGAVAVVIDRPQDQGDDMETILSKIREMIA